MTTAERSHYGMVRPAIPAAQRHAAEMSAASRICMIRYWRLRDSGDHDLAEAHRKRAIWLQQQADRAYFYARRLLGVT